MLKTSSITLRNNRTVGIKNIKPNKAPKEQARWAKHLHEGWQIDAKEEILTANGYKNCWLNIVDEHSGTVIDPPVFPLQKDK